MRINPQTFFNFCAAHTTLPRAEDAQRRAEDEFNAVMGHFNLCILPEYPAKTRIVEGIPDDFDVCITLFLKQQEKESALSAEIVNLLAETERWFGDEFRGEDERETVNILRGELEGLADKEEALARDWNTHLHGLKATFDLVLKNMGHVATAAGEVNRAFAKVRVSNLKSVKFEIIEHSDLMTWIKRLASFEPGGLFDHDPQQESAIANFRRKVQDNPVIQYTDLFTLGVTVVGADDRRAWTDDALRCDGSPTLATAQTAQFGVFSFFLGDSNRHTLHEQCAIVENPSIFTAFEHLALPVKFVFFGGGRISKRLLNWFAGQTDISFSLLHLPDYDPIGLDEFERLRKRLGDRVRLHAPYDLPQRFECFGNRDLLNKPNSQTILARLRRSELPEVLRIVRLIDRYNAALEQEALLLSLPWPRQSRLTNPSDWI